MVFTAARGQRTILACGSAAAALLAASGAWGQTAAPPASDALEEVVVTATRQADTVNRVPLSINAVTQRNLDQQGVKTVQDLARVAPSLAITSANQPGLANFTIRGLYSAQGAPTTGVYIDDVSVTKRATLGTATSQSAGTPTPPLFDLERVEVLRGPQGTLYGGSSEGGAIRYITPMPSLTRYTGIARGELSTTKKGGESYEGGLAVGGPIVQDKLGFRASVFYRKTGGWVDQLDVFNNGALRNEDVNSTTAKSIRLSLLWAPTDRMTVNLGWYGTKNRTKNFFQGDAVVIGPTNVTFVVADQCFAGSTTAVPCTTPGAYRRVGGTQGPFTYLTGHENFQRALNPFKTSLDIANVTVDYDFGFANLRSITSYIHDKASGVPYSFAIPSTFNRTTNVPTAVRWPYFPFLPEASSGVLDPFYQGGSRHGWSEEIRLSSKPDSGPLGFVIGAIYQWNQAKVYRQEVEDLNLVTQALFGIPSSRVYTGFDATGTVRGPIGTLPDNTAYQQYQALGDESYAGFGEANYRITEQLKAIAGVRITREKSYYSNIGWGPINGYLIPTVANGGILPKSYTSETPVTPKFGLQYEITSNDMIYATAAKGFRAGGVNVTPPEAICGPQLTALGLTIRDIPPAYGSDTVWSYEAGAKLRLGNRIQMNSSVYRIDWSDVQTNVQLPGCGVTFVMNAATAKSQGFDVQFEAKPLSGLTTSLSVAYVSAKYTSDAFGPKPANTAFNPTLIVQSGDYLPVPPWSAAMSAQYDFAAWSGANAYVRGDFQYTSNYYRSFGPGVQSYAPDSRTAKSTYNVSARAGVSFDKVEINVFANNLLNTMNQLNRSGGRGSCPVAQGAACTTPGVYGPLNATYARPREIGIQATYRY